MLLRLVRLFPIRPHTRFHQQRYIESGNAAHELRQFSFYNINFIIRYFQHQFIVHLQQQARAQLRVVAQQVARVGEQTALELKQRVKSVPSLANRSMFGVRMSGLP